MFHCLRLPLCCVLFESVVTGVQEGFEIPAETEEGAAATDELETF